VDGADPKEIPSAAGIAGNGEPPNRPGR